MVGVTSFSGNGLRDFLVQRVTAVILGLYTVFIFAFIYMHRELDYVTWLNLFSHPAMQIFSLFALLALMYHSWVGLWIILTDYVKPTALRLILQTLIIAALIGYVAWGITILWGL